MEPVTAPRAKPSAARCDCARQQKQRDKEFAEHKAHILANLGSNACDFSPKGSVDVKCHAIMDTLNTHPDFITTSSCSGRIALFHSIQGGGGGGEEEGSSSSTADRPAKAAAAATKMKMKRGAAEALGWLVVKHGMLLPVEMLTIVTYLCGRPETEADAALDGGKMTEWTTAHVAAGHEGVEAYAGELEGALFQETVGEGEPWQTAPPLVGTVAIKMEPFVMHVECRTMESAKELLSAAVSDSGYRNSGVVPPGKKIMCGIRSAAGLGMELPLTLNGVNYVQQQRAYVWALLELANAKMHANEGKTRLLAACVARRVAAMDEKRRKEKGTTERPKKKGDGGATL